MPKEHIAYAMNNPEATDALVYFHPFDSLLDSSFIAIELMILAGVILAVAHALREKKRTGSKGALITLLNCFLYGLSIDILSYYTVENFWHGEFSVMFLYNKLPLYIALFYPAFMYHSYMLIRRYQFPLITEALSVGFFSSMMYLIFDNFGPMVNWWVWDVTDPSTWPYVNSVPLTSYHWFFTFTIAFALVNRFIAWELPQKAAKAKLSLGILLQPIATILLGSLLFVPYNLFAKNMPPYNSVPWAQNLTAASWVHMLTFAFAAWWFLTHWQKPRAPKDNLLLAFPFIYLMGHSYLYVAYFDAFLPAAGNAQTLPLGNLVAVVLAIVGTALVTLVSHQSSKGKS